LANGFLRDYSTSEDQKKGKSHLGEIDSHCKCTLYGSKA